MAEVSQVYNVDYTNDAGILADQINHVLARLTDRLDQIQGLRGTTTFYSNIDLNGNRVTNVSPAIASRDGVTNEQLEALGIIVDTKADISDSTYWDDLRVPAHAVKLGGSRDPSFAVYKTNGSGSRGVFTYQFATSPANNEEVFFTVQMPHGWKEGTKIKPHVHFAPNSNPASNEVVRWGLEYTWANINSAYGNSTQLYVNQTIGTADVDKHYMTFFSDMDGTGKTISSMILCRLFRVTSDAADTYSDLVHFLEFDFHYESDAMGSSTSTSK